MSPRLDEHAVPSAPEGLFGLGISLSASFSFLLHSATAVLAPADCRVCALPLARASRTPVCDACLGAVTGSPFAACSRCGEALAMELARAAGLSRTDAVLCERCTEMLPPFERAVAFGHYGGSLRTLIHLHKFDGVRSLSRPLAAHLAVAVERACTDMSGTVHVVAVPLYRGRRAYNQSELMADEAVRRLGGITCGATLQTAHGLLHRTRATESQVHLTPAQRHKNVRGAFAVQGDVKGMQVLLIDDVLTTGATVSECTRVLLQAGAECVRVATLARAQREFAGDWESTARVNVALWPTKEM